MKTLSFPSITWNIFGIDSESNHSLSCWKLCKQKSFNFSPISSNVRFVRPKISARLNLKTCYSEHTVTKKFYLEAEELKVFALVIIISKKFSTHKLNYLISFISRPKFSNQLRKSTSHNGFCSRSNRSWSSERIFSWKFEAPFASPDKNLHIEHEAG